MLPILINKQLKLDIGIHFALVLVEVQSSKIQKEREAY